jgi:hypothetical protein
MNKELEELLKELKVYRNDMVARNYPFQEISDIITRWEIKLAKDEKRCTCGRSPTGSCIGWHKLTEEQYKKSLEHYNKHTPTTSEELQDELEPITSPMSDE